MRPVHTIYYVRIGAIAQLGERLHGMQEVDGSIPSSSTKFLGLIEQSNELIGAYR